jgi:hypothetical protein
MKRVIWVAVAILFGATIPAIAQELGPMGSFEYPNLNDSWHSTCERPMFDIDAKHGSRGIREAQIEFNEYQSCLNRQATNDAHYAAQAVLDSAKKELQSQENDAATWGFSIQ